MTYHATIYYRTATTCNTWMCAIQAPDHRAALDEARRLFARRRPRALRIDCMDCIEVTA